MSKVTPQGELLRDLFNTLGSHWASLFDDFGVGRVSICTHSAELFMLDAQENHWGVSACLPEPCEHRIKHPWWRLEMQSVVGRCQMTHTLPLRYNFESESKNHCSCWEVGLGRLGLYLTDVSWKFQTSHHTYRLCYLVSGLESKCCQWESLLANVFVC